jgi:hypothetical protein
MEGQKAKRESARVARALGVNPANLDEADAAGGWFYCCSLHDKAIAAPFKHWVVREDA